MKTLFVSSLVATTLALSGYVVSVSAQSAPPLASFKEGKDYRRLKNSQATDQAEKIEVIEFFSYACPHCAEFEPKLEAWVKSQGADVVVKRVPVAFNPIFAAYQKTFYALEAIGKSNDGVHGKIFKAIHTERKDLSKPEAMGDFLVTEGIAKDQFVSTYQSFGIQSKVARANQTAAGYQVDGVPMLAINGRYTSSAAAAGSYERLLQVASSLIESERQKLKAKPAAPAKK